MSKSTRRLTIAAVLSTVLLMPPAGARAAGQVDEPMADVPISDPIPQNPLAPRIGLTLREVAAFPKSDPTPPPTDPRLMRWARINFVSEVPDRSGRLAVPDLNGKLYLVKNGTPGAYLDLAAQFAPDFFSGRGLGSGFGFVAFHPEFKRNGKFYTVHTEAGAALTTKVPDLPPQPNPQIHGVITEWTAADPSADTFSGTRREMLRVANRGFIHGFQEIGFNPTAKRGDSDYGLLYVAAGDGGAGVASPHPQDLAMPHGKILRIDPKGTNGPNGRYGIPPQNPFVGRPGALGEIYAYGLRNPHRFSWDSRGDHRMFVGMIGEQNIEPIYEVRAGDNFGWTEREGPFVIKEGDPTCSVYPLPADDAQFGYTYPVAAYDHDRPQGAPVCSDSGDAVIGGYVYHGRIPLLRGKYVFGDDVNGRLMYTEAAEMRRGSGTLATIHDLAIVDEAGNRITMPDLAGNPRVDLRFGTDRDGEIYVLSKANGKVWKVTGARKLPHLPDIHPGLRRDVVAYYDFEHPLPGNLTREQDQGFSGTDITLINGKADMRVADGAFPTSRTSIQLQQVNPTVAGNDDWKAGVYSATGQPTLNAFNGVKGASIMGWFKMTGQNPSPNSNSADPADFYGAIGLAGVLSGDSDGHAVRALLELINVNGVMRVVALGRRIDGSASQTFAASADWQTILPLNEWVFLAATFDYNTGAMALYRNGRRVEGSYVVAGDPWGVGGPGPHFTSPTDPRGIKIGGSFPQNTRENNPCNCRMDSLTFLDRVVSPTEIKHQYRWATGQQPS